MAHIIMEKKVAAMVAAVRKNKIQLTKLKPWAKACGFLFYARVNYETFSSSCVTILE